MERTNEQINRINQLTLTAADQLYGTVWVGMPLGPINNMGTGAQQPYQTPGGFFLANLIEDSGTGFRLGVYRNANTHEMLVIPNGSDGWNLKDWASNGLYTGWNQWQSKAKDVMDYIRDAVDKDGSLQIYIGGQSLGGALAQYVVASLLQERQKQTIMVANEKTGEMVEAPNPLYQVDLNRFSLSTFAAPGVGDMLREKFPDLNLDSPDVQNMLIRHFTTQGEMVNMVGGRMLGGNGEVYYLPSDGTGDIGYLHRIPLGIWDGIRMIGADFASLAASERATLNTSNLQAIGSAVALLGANGTMSDTEGVARLGLALVVGAAISPPGEVTTLVANAMSRYLGTEAGTALGLGIEILSKGLLLANPVGWLRLVIGGLGIANLAHLTSSDTPASELANLGFTLPSAGAVRLPAVTTSAPDGDVTVVIDKSSDGVAYQIRLPNGGFWRSQLLKDGSEVATSPDGFTVVWDSRKPYATISRDGKELGIAYPDELKTLDGHEILLQRRSAAGQDFTVRYVPPAPGQNEVGIFIDGRQALLSGDLQSVGFDLGNGNAEQFSTWQSGINVLEYLTGGERYLIDLAQSGWVNASQPLLRRTVTDQASGKVLEMEAKTLVKNTEGQWGIEANTAYYKLVQGAEQLNYRIQERYFETIKPDETIYRVTERNIVSSSQYGDVLLSRTRTVQDGNEIVRTVDAKIGNDTVSLKYTGQAGADVALAEVVAINGKAPTDQDAAKQAILALGVDSNQLSSVSGEGVLALDSSALAGVLSQYRQPSGGLTIQQIGLYAGTLIDALSMVKSIQSGEPLPILASGLRLANDLSNLSGTPNIELSAASNAVSGVLSIYGLAHALENGDTLAAVTSGAQAIQFGAAAYAAALRASDDAILNISEIQGADAIADGLGDVLPYLGIVNSIAHGDMTGAAVGALSAMGVPYIGWAYAVYSIVSSLFEDEPEIPDPWGSGQYVWNGNSITYQAAGETGGKEAVEGVMSSTLATLNSLIERVRQQNPGSQLGIIPNRMPSAGYDMSGYRYTDIDPLTGAEKHPALRFDTSGRPYNADPGSPESYQSIVEGMVRSALTRGAIAPLWEVQTAKLQTDAGDPKAGLTEEERAGRDGQLAAPLTGASQTFRPVALDLDGDGIEVSDKAHGVAFNVDDSGYLKQTAWIKSDDALLVLDRNYNGQFDSGKELFSNGAVSLSRRGLAGMAWVDANFDGRLTAADPVWGELKVWRDLDQDGQQDAGEVQGLTALGVTELNYAMSTFTQNGVKKQLASPDLQADSQGTRVTVVPEGILVQASENGHLSLLVTRIDDKTALEANRDGITGYEDVEIIVNSTDLLANDTLGGILGRDLSVTGLTNFRHGTGYLDANGFVHFIPESNYSGSGAGFDYVAKASNGQTGVSSVDVTLQNVNDAPILDTVSHSSRQVFGYLPKVLDGNGNYVSGGEVLYEPYTVQVTYNNDEGSPYRYTARYSYASGYRDFSYNYDESGKPFYYKSDGENYSVYSFTELQAAGTYTSPMFSEDTGQGRVIGMDMDDPVSSLTYELINQPQYGGVSLNQDGTFQYTSWKEPGVPSDRILYNGQYAGVKNGTLYYPGNLPSQAVYPTTDVFQVKITDPHGASTIQSVSVPHYGPYLPPTPPGGGGGGKKPIAVDLSGNGFDFVNVNDSNVFFDVNGDGWKHRTSWIGKDDGLLAYDIDGDGKIDKPGEISFARYKEGAQSDLEGLRAFDSNGDGRFDAADDKWAKFGVWQDANQNGLTDPGEFRTLAEMGIAAVNLTSDGQFQIINGQTVHGMGSMTKADGSQIAIADVTFAYSNETQLPQGDGTTQTVNTSPFSPSGEEIVGTEDKDLILGKNGNNIVKGLGGDDVIFEDGGNDIIDGGNGNDLIYSGADNDLVMGGAGNDAIYAGLGSDVIFGGDGHDAIFAEGGNDVVFGGDGNDLIAGGDGNDVLSGDDGNDQIYGESGNDALFGRDGNDELLGMDGNDRLDGGAGNDLLDGGTGADEMLGGAGDDTCVVDNAADTVTELANEGNDTVRTTLDGYTLGANVENLTLSGSANLKGHGNELDNVLIGNRGNNTLTGGAGNDKLDGGLGADTLIGGTGDDTYIVDNVGDTVAELADEGIDTVKASVGYALAANVENLTLTGTDNIDATGNEFDNRLTGNAGDNRLDGGAGADVMAGGRGNDTYVVDEVGDVVTEYAAEGVDMVISSIDYVLGANIENLTLSGTGDLHGTGNELDNVIVGNVGNNVLDGGSGADTLAGGAGDDTYIVDNAGDTVNEAADAGTDTVFTSVTYTLSANVENLTLTGSANIDGTGNELANALTGNAGANRLDGGAGADVMAGGAGDDVYVVDNVGDVVREFFGEGTDSVLASVSFVLPKHVEKLTLTGHAAIDGTGNAIDNILVGNDAANVLDGAAGVDTMTGGAGDDIYYVDSLGDRVIEVTNGGYDTVRTTVSLTAPDNVERIELLGGDHLDATGNVLDNVLVGNSGNNRLDGGAGSDAMIGGAGDDIYIVDNAGDTVTEAAQEGSDTVFANVSYALSANIENLTLTGSADINATGNELGNTLVGNSGRNILDGGAGADAMAGGAGNDDYIVDNASDTVVEAFNAGIDTIYTSVSYVLPENVENLILSGNGNIGAGGNGADNTLIGNAGDNLISGGGGNDRLDGQAGNDTLDGGQGNDILIGGTGNDIYVINLGDGLDKIDDVSGTDTVRFGTGLSLDNVALRVTETNGIYTAHVRMLNAGGCEQQDQGFDFSVTVDRCGQITSPIEKFQFADGSIKTLNDLLINTRITYGTPWSSTITTGRDDDIIVGGPRNNVIRSGSGNDIVYAGAGGDTVYGEGGNDYLQGGTGNDTLDGGCGVDVLAGSSGKDVLRDLGGNNAFFGGSQDDTVEAGAGNDFIAGGMHNDMIQAGGGANVIAFNWGDGRDVVLPSVGASNTLSLGGGIDESNLVFKKTGSDLVLSTGGSSQITLKDWYAAAGNQTVDKLQVVESVPYWGWGQTSPNGWDIDTFDFKALVQQFDAARAANPKLSQWSLMNGLLDAHLSSSDSAALGGELATRYAAGGESAISLGVAQDTLKDAHFGSQAQAVGSRFDSTVCGYRIG